MARDVVAPHRGALEVGAVDAAPEGTDDHEVLDDGAVREHDGVAVMALSAGVCKPWQRAAWAGVASAVQAAEARVQPAVGPAAGGPRGPAQPAVPAPMKPAKALVQEPVPNGIERNHRRPAAD